MSTLKLTSDGSYYKRSSGVDGLTTAKQVFRYNVTGDEKDIVEYIAERVKGGAKETSIKTETGVKYYTDRFVPNGTSLDKTQDGRFFPNTAKWDQILSLQKQGHSYEAAVAMVSA